MKVTSFETPEDMFKFLQELRESEKSADQTILPWQHAVGPEDCFIRVVDDGMGNPIVIYGRVYESEYPEDRYHMTEPHMRNKRLAWCFSQVAPEGETGNVHVANMHIKITRDMFEAAKAREWRTDSLELIRLFQEQYQNDYVP